MRTRLVKLILFLLSTYPVITQAQVTLVNKADSAFLDTKQIKKIRDQTISPFGASSVSNFISNVSLSSFYKEGVNGKIELQGKLNSRSSIGLSLDQKINKSDNSATPLSLTGISPGTTVQFNLQKFLWKPRFNLSRDEKANLNELEKKFADSNAINDWRTIGLRDIYIKGTDEEKKVALDVYKRTFKQPFLVNIKAGFTKTSFSYSTDSVTLKTLNNAFITPTVTVSVVKALGAAFKTSGYFALSYNFSESYTAADDVNFIVPFGTTKNLYSNTLAFGKPTKTTTNSIILELRQNIFSGEANSVNVAISPTATLGIDSKKLSVFLPVYLIRGSDENGKLLDKLQSGVRFGYITSTKVGQFSSFKNGFTAQLIITQPLDFLSKF